MSYDLNNEEELKEYLEKVGIEYRFGCFSEKNPESCELLAEYLHKIKNDTFKAMKIYKTNCDDYQYGRSCYSYATHAIKGKGTKAMREEAQSYFEKGCAANFPDACGVGGMFLVTTGGDLQKIMRPPELPQTQPKIVTKGWLSGRRSEPANGAESPTVMHLTPETPEEIERLKPNRLKGFQMVEKGCSLGNHYACYSIGGLYILGSPNIDLPQDFKKAFKYSDKACRLGNPQACANISIMYRKGDGVDQDSKKAQLYQTMATDLLKQMQEAVEFQRT